MGLFDGADDFVEDLQETAKDAAENVGLEEEADAVEDVIQKTSGQDLGGSGGGKNAADVQNQGSKDKGNTGEKNSAIDSAEKTVNNAVKTGRDAVDEAEDNFQAVSGQDVGGSGGGRDDSDIDDTGSNDTVSGNLNQDSIAGEKVKKGTAGDALTENAPNRGKPAEGIKEVPKNAELNEKVVSEITDRQQDMPSENNPRDDRNTGLYRGGLNQSEAKDELIIRGRKQGQRQIDILTGEEIPDSALNDPEDRSIQTDPGVSIQTLANQGNITPGEASLLLRGGALGKIEGSVTETGGKIGEKYAGDIGGDLGTIISGTGFQIADKALIGDQIGAIGKAIIDEPGKIEDISGGIKTGFTDQVIPSLTSEEGVKTELIPEALGIALGGGVTINPKVGAGDSGTLAPGIVSGKLGSKVTQENFIAKDIELTDAQAQQLEEQLLVNSFSKENVVNNADKQPGVQTEDIGRTDLRKRPQKTTDDVRTRKKVKIGDEQVEIGFRKEEPVSRTEFVKDKIPETGFPKKRKGTLSTGISKETGKNTDTDPTADLKDDFFDADLSRPPTADMNLPATGFNLGITSDTEPDLGETPRDSQGLGNDDLLGEDTGQEEDVFPEDGITPGLDTGLSQDFVTSSETRPEHYSSRRRRRRDFDLPDFEKEEGFNFGGFGKSEGGEVEEETEFASSLAGSLGFGSEELTVTEKEVGEDPLLTGFSIRR